ncbi:MAG: ATP-binding protein, partial [Ignavibacteria bacterium]
IIKHSHANEVLVNIYKSKDSISILISDNGKGFSVVKVNEDKSKHGFGLKGIKERLKLFNGKLEIESHDGVGTSVKIIIPI